MTLVRIQWCSSSLEQWSSYFVRSFWQNCLREETEPYEMTTKTKMLRRLSVLIVLVIVQHSSSANASLTKERKCPYDITKLAFTSALQAQCKQTKQKTCGCSYDKYRSIDGSCNHVLTDSGAAGSVIDKLLPPTYDDVWHAPRKVGVGGEPLPSPRQISVEIFTDKHVFSIYTLLLFLFGQWTAHDMISTTTSSGRNCCGANGTNPTIVQPTNCFPYAVASNDPTFPGTCVSFVRSQAANCTNWCQIGFRVNTNEVTAFIDSSQIYGSSHEVEQSVREQGGYLLRTNRGNFLPESNLTCNKPNVTRDYCVLAGDNRCNQHSILTFFHTFSMRAHNRMATQLHELNPKLSNETIYQTVKSIINAIYQSILYNEYLPIVLGYDSVRRWNLLSTSGKSVYNPDLRPRMIQEAVTAAMRFGHSQIPGEIPVGNEMIPLRYLFNNPGIVLDHFEDFMDALIGRSQLPNQGSRKVDQYFTEDVSRYLFFNNKTGRGSDLPATNIQRGRDQGLATYSQVREICCLPPMTGFNDTKALGPEGYKLEKHYKSVDDIDLYVGGLLEVPESGLLGPTFNCLVGLQYYTLKHSDRFFFDNDQRHFTDEQVKEIRKVKLGEMICHQTNLTSVQKNVFEKPSSTNEDVSCSWLKKNGLDLRLFAGLND